MDIVTQWDVANSRGDWVAQAGQLVSGNDLVTAVLISLFTDRLADPDDVIPDGTTDPRGWWGDLDQTYPIGSKLWLISRSKLTQQVANDAQNYCAQALQWLIDDGVVASFDIATQIVFPNMLGVQITAHKPVGSAVTFNFSWAWDNLGVTTASSLNVAGDILDLNFILDQSILG